MKGEHSTDVIQARIYAAMTDVELCELPQTEFLKLIRANKDLAFERRLWTVARAREQLEAEARFRRTVVSLGKIE